MVEKIEALARAAESDAWRGPHDDLTDAGSCFASRRTLSSPSVEEDAQLAELLRVAARDAAGLPPLRFHDSATLPGRSAPACSTR